MNLTGDPEVEAFIKFGHVGSQVQQNKILPGKLRRALTVPYQDTSDVNHQALQQTIASRQVTPVILQSCYTASTTSIDYLTVFSSEPTLPIKAASLSRSLPCHPSHPPHQRLVLPYLSPRKLSHHLRLHQHQARPPVSGRPSSAMRKNTTKRRMRHMGHTTGKGR
jgi:hypothetical protein